MPFRPDEEKMREKLKNPARPINDTSCSPEFEQYLDDMNNNRLKGEYEIKQEQKKAKEIEEDKATLFCPTCRKATLKRHPQGYACGFCGLFTNSPLRMAVDEAAKKQNDK